MLEPLTNDDPRVIGPYRLQGRLGAGGMGTVYLGFSPQGAPAAVKYPHPDLAADLDFRARFRDEIMAARRVSGSFVAEVLDADVDAPRPWMATRYVDGVSLGEAVATRGRLDERLLTSLAIGLADALVAMHSAGVVHRDLKPANVLLAWDAPKVIDFGIARTSDATHRTRVGDLIGTLAWMAPEQLLGEHAGPPADVFAWGACVAFAASGRHPFAGAASAGGGARAAAGRILHAEPDLTGIPQPLASIVARALVREPAHRPSAEELVAALVGRPVTDPADAERTATAVLASGWKIGADRRVDRQIDHADAPGAVGAVGAPGWTNQIPGPEYPPSAAPGHPAYPTSGYPAPTAPEYPPHSPSAAPGYSLYAAPAAPPGYSPHPAPAAPEHPPYTVPESLRQTMIGPSAGGVPGGADFAQPSGQPRVQPSAQPSGYPPAQPPAQSPPSGPIRWDAVPVDGAAGNTSRIRRPRRYLVLASAVSVFLLVGVLVGVVRMNQNDEVNAQPPAATESPSQASDVTSNPASTPPPSTSAPPTVDPAQAQAVQMDGLLQRTSADRNAVVQAVGDVRACGSVTADAQTIENAGVNRDGIAVQLGTADFSGLPHSAELVSLLREAMTASAAADREYAQWARGVAAAGCSGSAPFDDHYRAGNAYSEDASRAKASFVELWNPIAAAHGLRQWEAGEL